jgi:PAS domain S-box-containing protein
MFDSGGSGPVLDAETAMRAVRLACGDDSSLNAQLFGPAAAILVLDAAGEHILYASEAAAGLREALCEPNGRLDPGLRLGEQIGRVRSGPGKPLLLRLHLDSRRIAPPALVTLLRTATEDGRAVVLLLMTGPLPKLRARAVQPVNVATSATALLDSSPDAPSDPIADVASTLVGQQRFTWRSEPDGTVSQLSRAPGDPLRVGMLGRTWQSLSTSGILRDAEGLIAALSQARTFRAIPITLVAPDGTAFELELSGSPIDRTGRGFRGFGHLRSVERSGTRPTVEPVAGPLAPDMEQAAPVEIETDMPSPELATVEADTVTPPDPALSSHEHAAFREIARALGARFAGDEALSAPPERGLPCAVMPFPVSAVRASDPAPAAPDAAMVVTLERLPVGVLVYRENAVLFANRRLLDLTGYADAKALDAAGGIERLFRGLEPHARETGDTPIVLAGRDGGSVGVLVEHSVLDWAGRPAELLLARDAEPSEAARAGKAAALAQDFAERRGVDALSVLDTLEDGIATLDSQARILSLNRSAAATFGVDSCEVVGASVLSLFAPEHAVALLTRLHAEPGAATAGAAHVTARGTGAPLAVTVLPLGDDAQNRLCVVIRPTPAPSPSVSDASEGRRSDEAASLRIADVLAKVENGIRAPITGILGLTDRMLNEPSGPGSAERLRADLRDIHASGTHVLDLVKDLLELARIEAGRLDLTMTEIPLNDVVAGCVALLQPQAARDRIVLRTSFSSDLATLVADERSVRQAALNVIANAIAFTEAGGQVIVSTTMADRGEIALRVRDTGIGMTQDEVEGALQPFRQVVPAEARKGTGLGLPLTKALVEVNRGRLRIDSRKQEGTLVEMLFPAAAATKRA